MIVYKLPFLGNKGGFGIMAIWPYLPTRFAAPEKFAELNNKILAFKNGIGAEAIADEIIGYSNILLQNLGVAEEWTLAVIPASNQMKTNRRFKGFANHLCLNLGFFNGFDLIKATGFRIERKLQVDRDSVNILQHLSFDNSVKGKKILLFDDVYTSGKTFELISHKLIALGAKDVFGLFLSKTVWPEENNFDFEFNLNYVKPGPAKREFADCNKWIFDIAKKVLAPINFKTGVYSKFGLNIDWIELPKGYYVRGGNVDKEWLSTSNKEFHPQHEVMIDSFKMALTTVTFEQFDTYCEMACKERPGDNSWGRGFHPVININWFEANCFANWLGCRLPTEAEWEYACRAGSKTAFNNGKDFLTNANFNSNRTQKVHVSGINDWILYGMHGNVWEWCSDWFGYYSKESLQNPKGPSAGQYKIIRGGCYLSSMALCTSYYRGKNTPNYKSSEIGFRLVIP